jgi:glycosyltransferase 2 family protein
VRYGASALLIVGMVLGVALAMLVHVPARWQHVRAVLHLSKGLRAICLGISALATLCNALTIFLLFRPLHVEIGFTDVMVLSPLVILVLTVHLSIGGWGLREASMAGLFALVGVPPAVSLSVSILSGLLATLVTLPGALVRLR